MADTTSHEWSFLQCFGERAAGEEIQDGKYSVCLREAIGWLGLARTCTHALHGRRILLHATKPVSSSRKRGATWMRNRKRFVQNWAKFCCMIPSPSMLATHTADIISAVEFDHTGLHLATGDRGGRVVLFERVNPNPVSCAGCATNGSACVSLNALHGAAVLSSVLGPEWLLLVTHADCCTCCCTHACRGRLAWTSGKRHQCHAVRPSSTAT